MTQRDSNEKVPDHLQRSGYKEGIVSSYNYSLRTPAFQNYDDSASVILTAESYYGNATSDSVSGIQYFFSGFAKAISALDGHYNIYSTNITAKWNLYASI